MYPNIRPSPTNNRPLPTSIRPLPPNMRPSPPNIQPSLPTIRPILANFRPLLANIRPSRTNIRLLPANLRPLPAIVTTTDNNSVKNNSANSNDKGKNDKDKNDKDKNDKDKNDKNKNGSNEASSSTTHKIKLRKKHSQTGWYEDNEDTIGKEFCSYDLLLQFLLKDNGKEYDIYVGKLEGKKIEVISRAVQYFEEKGYTHRKSASIKSKLDSISKTYSIANIKENSPGFSDLVPRRQDEILEGICQGYKLIKEHIKNSPNKEKITSAKIDKPFTINNALENLRRDGETEGDSDTSAEEIPRPKKKSKLSALDLHKNHIADALKIRLEMKREQYVHERNEAIRKIKMQLPEMLMKGIEYDLAKKIVDDILLTYEKEQ